MKSEGVEKTQRRQVEFRVFRYVQNWGRRAVGDSEKQNFGDACKHFSSHRKKSFQAFLHKICWIKEKW